MTLKISDHNEGDRAALANESVSFLMVLVSGSENMSPTKRKSAARNAGNSDPVYP